ncbi:MAG: aminofutalosine synthase MqnE [Candidatus Dormibacteria bacterium]
MPLLPATHPLLPIARKVEDGVRLDPEDGVRLFLSDDLVAVGRLADLVRRRLAGDVVFYNINRHINVTNVCEVGCTFCAFARRPGEVGEWTLTYEQVEDTVRALSPRVTEIHTVNGHHPSLPFEWYLEYIRRIHAIRPDIHCKMFTAAEIEHFSEISGLPHREVLLRLMDAGLGSMPGGGAEVLSERVHQKLYRKKIGPDQWIDIHRLAHGVGLRSTATMLYGHIETVEERVEHFMRLRSLQDETGGFTAFIPLAFHPEDTPFEKRVDLPSATTDLKLIAVARLMLDNFPHIKAYWISLGLETTQAALHFGASDVDGTVQEEHIFHLAGARSPDSLSEGRLRSLIEEAGRIPVERDTLYRPVRSVTGRVDEVLTGRAGPVPVVPLAVAARAAEREAAALEA